jgi:outer membrane murein-binding lipoprotein Lpp
MTLFYFLNHERLRMHVNISRCLMMPRKIILFFTVLSMLYLTGCGGENKAATSASAANSATANNTQDSTEMQQQIDAQVQKATQENMLKENQGAAKRGT